MSKITGFLGTRFLKGANKINMICSERLKRMIALMFHSSHTSFNLSGIGFRDGNGAGRDWRMGSSSPSRMVLSYPIPVPSCITGKTFPPHPRPLGLHEAPSHLVKLYFLLICPITSTIFLMKHISSIKIYLKLQLNLSHQIKSIFRKKLNNISKCLTRQSQKKKKIL